MFSRTSPKLLTWNTSWNKGRLPSHQRLDATITQRYLEDMKKKSINPISTFLAKNYKMTSSGSPLVFGKGGKRLNTSAYLSLQQSLWQQHNSKRRGFNAHPVSSSALSNEWRPPWAVDAKHMQKTFRSSGGLSRSSNRGILAASTSEMSLGEDTMGSVISELLPIAVAWDAEDNVMHGGGASSSNNGIAALSSFGVLPPSLSSPLVRWKLPQRDSRADVAIVLKKVTSRTFNALNAVSLMGVSRRALYLILRCMTSFEAYEANVALAPGLLIAVGEQYLAYEQPQEKLEVGRMVRWVSIAMYKLHSPQATSANNFLLPWSGSSSTSVTIPLVAPQLSAKMWHSLPEVWTWALKRRREVVLAVEALYLAWYAEGGAMPCDLPNPTSSAQYMRKYGFLRYVLGLGSESTLQGNPTVPLLAASCSNSSPHCGVATGGAQRSLTSFTSIMKTVYPTGVEHAGDRVAAVLLAVTSEAVLDVVKALAPAVTTLQRDVAFAIAALRRQRAPTEPLKCSDRHKLTTTQRTEKKSTSKKVLVIPAVVGRSVKALEWFSELLTSLHSQRLKTAYAATTLTLDPSLRGMLAVTAREEDGGVTAHSMMLAMAHDTLVTQLESIASFLAGVHDDLLHLAQGATTLPTMARSQDGKEDPHGDATKILSLLHSCNVKDESLSVLIERLLLLREALQNAVDCAFMCLIHDPIGSNETIEATMKKEALCPPVDDVKGATVEVQRHDATAATVPHECADFVDI